MQSPKARQEGALERLKKNYTEKRQQLLERKNKLRIDKTTMSESDQKDAEQQITYAEKDLERILKEANILCKSLDLQPFKP